MVLWVDGRICWCYLFRLVGSSRSRVLNSSVSVKAAKELRKEGRKETKIPFKFQLYFWVSYGYSVAWRCLPGLFREQLRLPNKVLKCTSRFRWLIRPYSVWLYLVSVFYKVYFDSVGSQAAGMARYQATKPNQYMSSL